MKLALAEIFPNELDNSIPRRHCFQQDGVPAHFGVAVRRYLDDVFPIDKQVAGELENGHAGVQSVYVQIGQCQDCNNSDISMCKYLFNNKLRNECLLEASKCLKDKVS